MICLALEQFMRGHGDPQLCVSIFASLAYSFSSRKLITRILALLGVALAFVHEGYDEWERPV